MQTRESVAFSDAPWRRLAEPGIGESSHLINQGVSS